MSKAQHTPGPFTAHTLEAKRLFRCPTCNEIGESAAFVTTNDEIVVGRFARKEDAQLFSVAPDMAEALKDFLKIFGSQDKEYEEITEKTRAALAKAGVE